MHEIRLYFSVFLCASLLAFQGFGQGQGYPVVLHSDTLFYLYANVSSYTAAERARVISRRIDKLYRSYVFTPDSLRMETTPSGYDIVYESDFTVMSVAQPDALRLNTTPDSLANSYRAIIIREIAKEKKANSFKSWVRRIGLTAVIIAGLLLVIYGINILFRRSAVLIRKNRERYARGFTIRTYRIFSGEKLEQFVLRINRFLRIILLSQSFYLAVLLLSGVFTATEKWSDTLLGWILTPAQAAARSLLHFLPNLFTILVIYYIIHYTVKGVKYFSGEVDNGNIEITGFHRDWARPTFSIVRFLLYVFLLILVFPLLPGSESEVFRGVSVFLGVLISLGSSSAISNLVAGLVITYMRPFKVGDRVKIGDITGDVVEKNMLVTRIRTNKNEDVTVPNSKVLSGSSINYSANTNPKDEGLIVHTTVSIGYDTPWKDMHKALIEAAGRTRLVEKSPAPFVHQTSLGDVYVTYQLNAYTKEANKQAHIYSELHEHIQDCRNEAGIEILSPHYTAVRDGTKKILPDSNTR